MRKGINDRNRGKGSRGGVGKSGWKGKSHKLKKLLELYPEHFKDKKGFIPPTRKTYRTITLEEISHKISSWLEEGIAQKDGEKIVVDLTKTEYNKVLGTGRVEIPIVIKVRYATQGAIEKVQKANGEIILIET